MEAKETSDDTEDSWTSNGTSFGSGSLEDDAERNRLGGCKSKYRRIAYSSSEDDEESIQPEKMETEWLEPAGRQPEIKPFLGRTGLRPLDGDWSRMERFYSLLVPDDLFLRISEQTNLHASQVLSERQAENRSMDWTDTSKEEMKAFFGLVLWMGIVQLPDVTLYWSRDSAFAQRFPRTVMSRNRFEILLRMLQFSSDGHAVDRLSRIKPLIDELNESFEKYYDPPENVCVEESLVLLGRERKNNFRMFALCSEGGYTHRFQIYTSGKSETGRLTPTSIAMSLCEPILGKGRMVHSDSWFTSLELAQRLISEKTHLVGPVRASSPGLCKEVLARKLRQGETFAKEHQTGITLIKWRNRRNLLGLSTKHSTETATVKRRGHDFTMPALISDYTKVKSSVDVSEEIVPYSADLPRRLKWYKRLAIELLLGTAVVNAWVMFNQANCTSVSICRYRQALVAYLCNRRGEAGANGEDPSTCSPGTRHELRRRGDNPTQRGRCVSCYKENVKSFDSKTARARTKRVTTFCEGCADKPYLCLDCFNTIHRYIPTT